MAEIKTVKAAAEQNIINDILERDGRDLQPARDDLSLHSSL
jgi:hypothetical protein